MDAQRFATAFRQLPDFRGKGRVALELRRRASHVGMLEAKMRTGHRMVAPRTSTQTWRAAMTGRYDDPLLAEAARFISPGSRALDIGGCFGFWTIPLAMAAIRVEAAVTVYEPVPANLAILRSNVALNDLGKLVDVRPYGLGPEAKFVTIEVEEGVGNATISDPDKAIDQTEVVEVRRLDDEVFDRPVSFVKLDVEGYEMDVLEGAERFIADHRPVIFGEFNEGSLFRRADRDTLDYRGWAEGHGYRLEGLDVLQPLFGQPRLQRCEPRWPATIAMFPDA